MRDEAEERTDPHWGVLYSHAKGASKDNEHRRTLSKTDRKRSGALEWVIKEKIQSGVKLLFIGPWRLVAKFGRRLEEV